MIEPSLRRRLENLAQQHSLRIKSIDEDRPWGGEFFFTDEQAQEFATAFFTKLPTSIEPASLAQPKFLIIAPHQRFSWQYHRHRGELWTVLEGPVGIEVSRDDTEPDVKTLQTGDSLETTTGMRHRLVGQNTWGVVAELWVQTDPNHPSAEADNVRLHDDYGRH